jgi:hypothetical protein
MLECEKDGFSRQTALWEVTHQPLKKPKGKELTTEQKEQNKDKSKIRVVVEHSIRGLKIWRIAKDLCRTWRTDLRDYNIFIPCGLHNFRLRVRGRLSL